MPRIPTSLLLAVALSACGDVSALDSPAASDPAEPAEAEGLHLSLEAAPREITPGEPARIVAVLTNNSADSVLLRFENSCQLLVYLKDGEGTAVVPYDGRWMCLDVRTSLALAPDESTRQALSWTGRRRLYDEDSPPLPAGEYTAYVTLNGRLERGSISLRSVPKTITLRH